MLVATSLTLNGLYRKNERGYRLKANYFSSWLRPIKFTSDVSVSRNWYKTVSNLYENSLYIYISRFKQIIFSKYATTLKTKLSQINLIVNYVFSNYYFIIFIFIFFIDIIDNIIFKSIITSPELPQLVVQYSGLVSLSASRDHQFASLGLSWGPELMINLCV